MKLHDKNIDSTVLERLRIKLFLWPNIM